MSRPTQIAILIFDGMTQLDATGPYEALCRMPNAKVHLFAPSVAPVTTEWGMRILPDAAFAEAPPMDVICVPGGGGVNAVMQDAAILRTLSKQASAARYVTSVCTGALVLGAAGLLRGYRATTHWLSLDLLTICGATPVDARVVVDRNRITGGGVTAGIDFGLAIVAEVAGRDAAEQAQLMMEYDPKPPFDAGSPRVARPELVAQVREARRPMHDERARILARAVQRVA